MTPIRPNFRPWTPIWDHFVKKQRWCTFRSLSLSWSLGSYCLVGKTWLICGPSDVLIIQYTDSNLSPGCFGTDIIQTWTKWSQMRFHGLFAKFQYASFLVRTNQEKTQEMLNILKYKWNSLPNDILRFSNIFYINQSKFAGFNII